MAAGRLTWPRAVRPFGQLEEWQRFGRRRDAAVLGLVALVIALVPVRELILGQARLPELWAHDFGLYLDAAARWLAGGPYYPAEQLTGPIVDDGNRILYPPAALWLFGPLAVLPRGLAAIAWWAFPIAAMTYQVVHFRPRPIVWPFIAICLAWPPTLLTVVVWNSAPVFVGLLALGTIHRWTAALILLKPSVMPFALWGVSRRSWWLAAGLLAFLSLPLGALWLDWLQVVRNSHEVGGILHSLEQFPMFLIPILVWLGRSRSNRSAGAVEHTPSQSA